MLQSDFLNGRGKKAKEGVKEAANVPSSPEGCRGGWFQFQFVEYAQEQEQGQETHQVN